MFPQVGEFRFWLGRFLCSVCIHALASLSWSMTIILLSLADVNAPASPRPILVSLVSLRTLKFCFRFNLTEIKVVSFKSAPNSNFFGNAAFGIEFLTSALNRSKVVKISWRDVCVIEHPLIGGDDGFVESPSSGGVEGVEVGVVSAQLSVCFQVFAVDLWSEWNFLQQRRLHDVLYESEPLFACMSVNSSSWIYLRCNWFGC